MTSDRETDSAADTYEGTIPADTSTPVAIVEAVATVKGCDPMDLPPLGDAVDLDAIAQLLRSASSACHVHFTVASLDVTVHADESLTVEPA